MWLKKFIPSFFKDVSEQQVKNKLPTFLWSLRRRQAIFRWGIHFYLQMLHRFRHFSPFNQRLISNLMIGIGLSVFIVLGSHVGIQPAFDVATLDWTMEMFLNTKPEKADTPPFVLLDIDEVTYREWEEPATIPRNHLLKLIQFAVQGQAQMIFVDIDLGYPNHLDSPKLTLADKQLFDFLNNYEIQYCGANKNCPAILLVRTTRPLLQNGKVLTAQYPQQRTSFLESAVEKSPHLHWVSVGFLLDKDNTLRSWQLWEAACQPTAVIPSTQLLAVALIKDRMAGAKNVEEALKPFSPQDCQSHTQALITQNPPLQNAILTLGQDTVLHLTPSPLGSSIVYTIPQKLSEGQSRAKTQQGKRIFETVSAYSILSTAYSPQSAQDWVKDKIVTIGSTYEDSRDIYHTPVGMMPGVLIVINAINSLLQYGELIKPPLWQVLLFEILIIILMSLVFARFCSFLGMIIAGSGIIIALLPLSFWLFKYGIWLDVAIPLIVMQLYRMSQDFERKS